MHWRSPPRPTSPCIHDVQSRLETQPTLTIHETIGWLCDCFLGVLDPAPPREGQKPSTQHRLGVLGGYIDCIQEAPCGGKRRGQKPTSQHNEGVPTDSLGASANPRPAGSRATILGSSPGAQGEYTAPYCRRAENPNQGSRLAIVPTLPNAALSS